MNNYIFEMWVIPSVITSKVVIAAPTRFTAMEIFMAMGYNPGDVVGISIEGWRM